MKKIFKYLFLIIVIGVVEIIFPVMDCQARNGWFEGWDYCRAIAIHNTSGQNLLNYYVKVKNPIYEERDLLGSWHFDTIVDNKTLDSSGNGKDARVYAANLTYSKFGKGLDLNGQGAYVDCGDMGLVAAVEFFLDDTNSFDGILELNPTVSVAISSRKIIVTGIAAPKIYVNGVKGDVLSSRFNHVVIATDNVIEATAVKIGVANAAYTKGIIDEVRLYSRNLNDNEVYARYQAKAKLDYADVRFTDTDGLNLLKYFMEEDGVFWVKVPKIAKSSTKLIYIYYGNNNAYTESEAGLINAVRSQKDIVPGLNVHVNAEQNNF